MLNQSIDSSLAAIDQIHHAFGQPRLFEQLIDVMHGERHALAGLEDECIAGRDRVRQIPERNHARKIEWYDRRHDSERLANHYLVDTAGDVFEVVTLHHHWNSARDFHVLDGATHLAFRFAKG